MRLMIGVARVPLDALAVCAALLLSYRLREAAIDLIPRVQLLEPATTLPPFDYYVQTFVMPGIGLFLVLSAFIGLYTLDLREGAWKHVGRIILAVGLWLVVVNAWFLLVLRELFFSRVLLLQAVIFMTIFVSAVRASLILLERAILRRGMGKLLVVSVGSQEPGVLAKETLLLDLHYAYLGHLTHMESLRSLAASSSLDLVLQTDPNPVSDDTIALINFCRSHHVGYAFLPPVLADVPHQLKVERLGLMPMIRFQPTPLDGWGRVWKRVFDIIVSACALIILFPLLIVIGSFCFFLQGRPIFYRSTRVGQEGRKLISLWKFRSMVRNADEMKKTLEALNHRQDGPLFKVRNDPRVTPFGRFIRRFSLDELPQLWNVLKGDLSLVGPRPHLPQEVARYKPEERRVFAVKPGLTGLAQVSGRSDLSFEEEARLDLRYVEEWSMLLDLWVLWRTPFVVLSRRGAD